ncbi:hypothetical protein P4O66_004559 [Electrophorus voltai]|uniref:SEC7 domain-containing protein n=1 Tax=Electrophorus voltai TaxID=2609070 RepID=A0AAD8ZLL1_9TELE|nr:hypothetical protein P4O66_004559 [Electrophorus voltai]
MESVEKESGVKHHSRDISKPVPPPLPRHLSEWVNEKAEDKTARIAEFSGVIHVFVRARKCRKWRDANAEMKSAFWTTDWQFQSPSATTICDGVKRCKSITFYLKMDHYLFFIIPNAHSTTDLALDRCRMWLACIGFCNGSLNEAIKQTGGPAQSQNTNFAKMVAKAYLAFVDFTGMRLDVALRLFLKAFMLEGSNEKQAHILAHFYERYHHCNPTAVASVDVVHCLTCVMMVLNTELHGENVILKMSCHDLERQRHFARAHANWQLPRQMNPVYLQPAAMHSSNHIIKFADDTTMVGLINKDNKSAYRGARTGELV